MRNSLFTSLHTCRCMLRWTCVGRLDVLVPLPHPCCVQAGRAGRTEKINAWRLNECGECWIDRDSKLGQQDCLFKGQDPLIIVLAEIDSQACGVPSLTPRYLHLDATRGTKHMQTIIRNVCPPQRISGACMNDTTWLHHSTYRSNSQLVEPDNTNVGGKVGWVWQ